MAAAQQRAVELSDQASRSWVMEPDDQIEALQEAALSRGYRLKKSRTRTPGKGDYGKVGLTTADGKEIMGFDKGKLAAEPAEIETFLRNEGLSEWTQSAKVAAKWKAPKRAAKANAAHPESSRQSDDRRNNGSGKAAPQATPKTRHAPISRQRKEPVRKVEPEPELQIRDAAGKDAAAIAKLLARMAGKPGKDRIRAYIESCDAGTTGAALAEQGEVVGFVSWTIITTPHLGNLGRITSIYILEDRRREAIGTQLLAHAQSAMAAGRPLQIEAMGDFDFSGAHSFLRKFGFNQTGYRFAKPAKK